MTYPLKDVARELARFILILAIIAAVSLDLFLLHESYLDFLSRPWVTLKGNPVVPKEEIAKASKHHGSPGFEVRCQEYTFTRDRDGRVYKAFKK
jgi:hypothetical protein